MSDFAKKILYGCLAVIGLSMVLSEIIFQFPSNGDSTIIGATMGLGSGLSAVSIANLIMIRKFAKDPKLLKQKNVEVNDERNKMVLSISKSKVYDLFNVLWWIFAFGLVLARVEFWITGTLMVVIALRTVMLVYFTNKVNKEN